MLNVNVNFCNYNVSNAHARLYVYYVFISLKIYLICSVLNVDLKARGYDGSILH